METILKELKGKRIRLSDKTKRVMVDIIGYLFIALFIYAALNKLLDYEKFKAQMGQSAMLTPYVNILAWAVPCLEILIAMLLFIPRTVLIGLYSAFTLMMLFTAYIGILLVSGDHLPCSCGGVLEKMSWPEHLIFNLCYVLFGIVGILFKNDLDKNRP